MDRIDETAALYEDLICKVQGVFSAKVKVNGTGDIIECHVLADRSRNVKQLVRDVQSALMAKFRIDLDYKLISVAQVDNLESILTPSIAPSADYKQPLPQRIRIRSFLTGYENGVLKAVVTLISGELSYTGEAGGVSGNNLGRVLAQATVNALSLNIDEPMALNVLDVQKVSINGQYAYAVAIQSRSKGREETLLGAAMIKEDENMAVVRAALDALNRRLFTPPVN